MTCQVEGCERKPYRRGWCRNHYRRVRLYDDPLGGRTEQGLPLRFIDMAVTIDTDACIEWPYGVDSDGYGQVFIDGRKRRVSHVVLERSGHPRPGEARALHSCDHPPCLNRRHLRWGSDAENSADRVERGRSPRGTKNTEAKLLEADIPVIRKRLFAGERHQDIAADYGVSRAAIGHISSRRNWRHVS
jgi:hypothetical protein